MGKYQAIFEAEEALDTEFSPEEAVVAVAMVALFADGEPDEEEIQILNDIINESDLFEDYGDDDIQAMFDKITGLINDNEGGLGVLFNTAVESLPEDWTETAFEAAAAVVLSNESVEDSEDSFLSDLAQALDLSQETAQEIIDELISDYEEEEEEEEEE